MCVLVCVSALSGQRAATKGVHSNTFVHRCASDVEEVRHLPLFSSGEFSCTYTHTAVNFIHQRFFLLHGRPCMNVHQSNNASLCALLVKRKRFKHFEISLRMFRIM